MQTEFIKELIKNSQLNQLQKNVFCGFIERAEIEQEKNKSDRLLIENIASEKKLSEIIFSNDDVKIYTVYGMEEWDTKYPFRSIFLNEKGNWERSNTVAPNFDLAYLVYLEKKHLGFNSQFVDFATKMLEIKLD
jgi:hypothetical protein